MAKRKWRKPTKKEAKTSIQFFLMCYGMCIGFGTTYLSILIDLGITDRFWAVLLAAILGAASCFGLFAWIVRGKDEDG